LRIGIDLMGGDSPPHLFFGAVVQAAERLASSHAFLLVIATQAVIDRLSVAVNEIPSPILRKAIAFHAVSDAIAMADDPLGAIRRKRNSSIVVGMRLLKKRQIDAFVSCGNTGALIAGATLSLTMLPGIARPGLLATLPTEKGPVAVLDVGGNISCKARNLVQFAFLGAAYQRAVQGIEVPSVGLLNVGVESKKGTAEVCQAYELLKTHCQDLAAQGFAPRLHFAGNVEGRDLFKGVVDVLVTDGFSGNVLLKTAEGVAGFIFSSLAESVQDRATESLQQSFNDLKKLFNYDEYPGAIICGVDGIVIKIHGNASPKALLSSIIAAADCVQKKVLTLIKEQLQT
jgi:glycerol-3-phosphate acyltransferase PlsX